MRDMGFSDRLKKLREEKGLSQEQLAEKLDINRTSVVHYESGSDRIPRTKRLQEIADFFNVSVDYLLGRSDEKNLTVKEKEVLYDIEEKKLSAEDLKEKYKLTIDGEPASDEEIEGAIAFIRSLRGMK